MTEEIIISGFGGQGVLAMGKVLGYSGVMENKEVCWMPSYGPEMRGGTCNVTLTISDERISSPILNEYDTAIILNQPSLDKFEKLIKPGGTLLYDTNGITRHPERKDISIYKIEAANIATEIGNTKFFNMIVLGAYLKIKPIVKIENVTKGLEKSLPKRYHNLIPANIEALQKGIASVKKVN